MENPPVPFGGPLDEVADDEKMFAMMAHLSGLVCLAIIGPIVTMLVKQDSAYVRYHSIQAICFQLACTIFVTTIAWVTCGLGAPLALIPIIGGIYMGIQAYNGSWDGYPMLSGIGKPPPKLQA